jgi:hypothetical protein
MISFNVLRMCPSKETQPVIREGAIRARVLGAWLTPNRAARLPEPPERLGHAVTIPALDQSDRSAAQFTSSGILTEIDPEDPDIAFGLCDLGFGYPELGSVSLSELESVRGQLGLPIERDLYFTPTKTLSAYADEAPAHGGIRN